MRKWFELNFIYFFNSASYATPFYKWNEKFFLVFLFKFCFLSIVLCRIANISGYSSTNKTFFEINSEDFLGFKFILMPKYIKLGGSVDQMCVRQHSFPLNFFLKLYTISQFFWSENWNRMELYRKFSRRRIWSTLPNNFTYFDSYTTKISLTKPIYGK